MPARDLPPLTLVRSRPRDTDALVVGLAEAAGAPTLVGLPDDLDKAFAKRFGTTVAKQAASLGATPRLGTTVVLPGPDGLRVVVVGLGDVDVTPEQIRRAAGNAVRAVAKLAIDGPLTVAVSLDAIEPEVIKGAAEGALLGAYVAARIGATPAASAIDKLVLLSSSTKAEAKDAVEMAGVVARAVCQTRDWVNAPPNLLYPETLADQAKDWAKESRLGISVEVFDDGALERDGFGGILAVGGGSARKPRLVRYSYSPRGAKFHLALVGKGITFDSGGVDIKTADAMHTMKCDMAGAAAVLAATRAIAELGLRIRVTAYAALAENLPSGTAYRPSDVLTMYGGKTVENGNTDAEGRLVLADAIARASQDAPHMIVDIATLTGACIAALGRRVGGLMASDDQAADHVLDAAEAAGEAFWQLPIPDDVADRLASDIADLRSAKTPMVGGALMAAGFLREFVGDGIPWAHLDIAGPGYNGEAAYDYVPAGGTGVGVRTLVALAQSLQS